MIGCRHCVVGGFVVVEDDFTELACRDKENNNNDLGVGVEGVWKLTNEAARKSTVFVFER